MPEHSVHTWRLISLISKNTSDLCTRTANDSVRALHSLPMISSSSLVLGQQFYTHALNADGKKLLFLFIKYSRERYCSVVSFQSFHFPSCSQPLTATQHPGYNRQSVSHTLLVDSACLDVYDDHLLTLSSACRCHVTPPLER